MKDKTLRLLKVSLIFFTVNSYAELGAVVCFQLPIDKVYQEVCPIIIGALEITESAKSVCSSQLFSDAETVTCLSSVGELEIPDSIRSACFHPDYTDNRIKCLRDSLSTGISVNLPDRNRKSAIEDASCSVENIFEYPQRVVDRSLEIINSFKVIKMKDQKVYALATRHLNPHISDPVLWILPSLLMEGNQKEEAYAGLKDILYFRSNTVISEKTDVLHMIKLLRADNSELKWIGVEKSEEELKEDPTQNQINQYRQFKSFLTEVLTPQEVEDTLYLIYNAEIIAAAEHPELFKEVEFIPLEDNVYAREGKNFAIEADRILKELYFAILSSEIEDADRVEAIAARAIVNVTQIPQQLISDELSKWRSSESKSLVEDFFRNTNQFVEYMSKRDQAMVATILEQSGNGLILTGSSHSKGITQRLSSACRDLQ